MPCGYCIDDGTMLQSVDGSDGIVWECPACGRRAPSIKSVNEAAYRAEDDAAYRSSMLETLVCPECGAMEWNFLRGDIMECRKCKARQFVSFYLATRGIDFRREWANWSCKGNTRIDGANSGVRRLRPRLDGRRLAVALRDGSVYHAELPWVDGNPAWKSVRYQFSHVCDLGWARNGHLVVVDIPERGLLEFGDDFGLVDVKPTKRSVNALFNDSDGDLVLIGVDEHRRMALARYGQSGHPFLVSDDHYVEIVSACSTSLRCGQDLVVLDIGDGVACCRMRASRGGSSRAIWRGQQGFGWGDPSDLAVNQRADWIAVADKGQKKLHLVDMAGVVRDSMSVPFSPCSICFSGDGRKLLIGEAGNPVVHLYERKVDYTVARERTQDAKKV